MADKPKDTDNVTKVGSKADQILNSIFSDLNKAKSDSVKAQLKKIVEERLEHEKAIKLLNEQQTKLLKDYEDGLV